MDTMQAILTRRSVRKFTNQPIKDEIVELLLRAAMSAPSANDQRPWQFLVINQRNLLDQIPSAHPYAKMCQEATLAILVCGDTSLVAKDDYIPHACSAATQNIMIAARALDLGSVWLGVYPNQDRIAGITGLFKLPENIIPFSLVALGHTDVAQNEVPERYQVDRIHYNNW